ncbi:MAG: Crp/Fnr family transcriptional regulator [Erysipelotrichaceae bacterium]|jgi:CRP-like cAMP-binding protein|nr:Crp/Fnr family transcriptional regulator [Erysipelotrichaceae bacterium]
MPTYESIKTCPLFARLDDAEIEMILCGPGITRRTYQSGEILIRPEQTLSAIGFLIDGEVNLYKIDYDGNQSLIARFCAGDLFAETVALTSQPAPVLVQAGLSAEVLWLDVHQLLKQCPTDIQAKLTGSLLQLLSEKILFLMKRLEILTKRSIREKVLTYLQLQAESQKQKTVLIPHDRQQMADYLCVECTALSYQLSKLRQEGILDYHKNRFILKFKDGT